MSQEELKKRQKEAIRIIRNHLVHKGETPSMRELMKAMGYKSPRSAALIIASLVDAGYLEKADDSYRLLKDLPESKTSAKTIAVPLVGSAACGTPIFAEENIESYFQVATSIAKPNARYFILRAEGDSMDRSGIKDGDFVLVRQQNTADDGQRVVALIDNEATIKELRKGPESIALLPRSNNSDYQPIILSSDFKIQGVVIAVLPLNT